MISFLKGCFYHNYYYENGERINSTDPCLQCICNNSRLKCTMKVCPLIKPVQDGCIIERNPKECKYIVFKFLDYYI